ncbi:unnamed protein product [Camellia sinensis]
MLSLDGKQNHMLRALPLAPVKRSAVIDLESSLSSSENALTRSGTTKTESLEQDTVNPRICYCRKCNQPKPPRCHHCSVGGVC